MGCRAVAFALLLGFAALPSHPARACGFGEAPGDCGQTAESDAREMLRRVVAAVQADEARALQQFARGEGGFRTVDNYVFCVGPDGVMSAHPNPALQGTDVRDLHDSTGNHFIATMLRQARPGQVASIRYLFPRPGGTLELAKTTYYTRAGDQMCGVGFYDEAEAAAAPQSPQARLAQLRARLTAGMPASLGADWTAFQQALDGDAAAKAAAFAKAREQVHAAETVLGDGALAAAR